MREQILSLLKGGINLQEDTHLAGLVRDHEGRYLIEFMTIGDLSWEIAQVGKHRYDFLFLVSGEVDPEALNEDLEWFRLTQEEVDSLLNS